MGIAAVGSGIYVLALKDIERRRLEFVKEQKDLKREKRERRVE